MIHVSHNFLHGPNGFFKETRAKRQRLQEDNHVFGSDPSHVQQLQYLRELDLHPALVLNADYQVGYICNVRVFLVAFGMGGTQRFTTYKYR